MKKFIFIHILFSSMVFAQSNKEPVYLYNYLLGSYVCEYAENGTQKTDMKDLIPYITDGKFFFVCLAAPVKTGNLNHNFEFSLSNVEQHIKGKYNGSRTDSIQNQRIVAGFAEKGKITITDVFIDDNQFEQWTKTVKIKTL